jgi:hypothetical protein
MIYLSLWNDTVYVYSLLPIFTIKRKEYLVLYSNFLQLQQLKSNLNRQHLQCWNYIIEINETNWFFHAPTKRLRLSLHLKSIHHLRKSMERVDEYKLHNRIFFLFDSNCFFDNVQLFEGVSGEGRWEDWFLNLTLALISLPLHVYCYWEK